MYEQIASWKLDAGALALDFLNTRSFSKGYVRDRLGKPSDLQSWLTAAGLVGSAGGIHTSPPAARMLLDEARRLRTDVLMAVSAHVEGEPTPAFALAGLNRVLRASRTSQELLEEPDGLTLFAREDSSSPLARLAPIARDAARLIMDVPAKRIRQCDSGRCVLWFLDTSKSGRRRWCSMATCGNREKAAKHYRKKQQEQA